MESNEITVVYYCEIMAMYERRLLVYVSDRGNENEFVLLSWLHSPNTSQNYRDWRLREGGGGIYIESKITPIVNGSLARQKKTTARDM